MKMRFMLLLLVAITVCPGGRAYAEENQFSYALSPYVGYHYFSDNRPYKDSFEAGIRAEKYLTDAWGVEFGVGWSPTKNEVTGNSKDDLTYSLNGTYHFLLSNPVFQPYLTAGLAGDYIENISLNGPNAGIGAQVFLADGIALRPEVRYINLLNAREECVVSLGLTFLLGKAEKAKPAPAAAAERKPPPVAEQKPAPVVAAPGDSDNDGVADDLDKCPNTPAGVKVDSNGCPLDSDNDGVADYLDKCPDTPAGAKVDSNGCPLDSDRDGVPDYLDKCPDTPGGAQVDKNGCVESITLKVHFDAAKSIVKKEYLGEIEKLANYLKQYPDVKMEIEGHTDNLGNAQKNQVLSQERADAIKNILVEQYHIDSARLSAKGYGSARPLASNKTKEGREQNRRVEAVTLK